MVPQAARAHEVGVVGLYSSGDLVVEPEAALTDDGLCEILLGDGHRPRRGPPAQL